MKANLLYILFFLNLFCFQLSNAQEPSKKEGLTHTPIEKKKDTITTDSIKKPKEVIEYKVIHNAEDYTIKNAKNKTITLYNKAQVIYGDIDLKAGKIIVDYKKNTVYATGITVKDSTKAKDSAKTKYEQRPVFKQGNQESEQDSILFNFNTKKALVYGVKTVQGEMITYGEKTKRVNDSTVYMRKLRFTTSKKANPDYYIATNKAKLVPGKRIIVGGSQLVIADVPTPLYLPFAYFPLTQKRASGFIIPSWGENHQQGYFLQNGGYYFAVNDYFDLEVTGDVYTNGSWGINSNTNYYVRYKYSGGFSFRYQNLINSIRGFNDYSKTAIYNITWNHSQDQKSSPNSKLAARVNLGSTKFYRESISQLDHSQFLNNTLNSSINYYKKFVGTPFDMNVTLSHSQNSNTGVINMTLPSLNISMDKIFPFAGKGGVKKNALQKTGVTYRMQGEYNINTTDDDFFTSRMFKEAKRGVQHTINASTNIKAFKYFTLTPNANYKDVWYFDKIQKRYDKDKVVNDTIAGFTRFNDYGASLSLSTNIYGTFNFKKGRLKTIRHTFRPSVSWSYRPKLDEKYNLQVQKSNNPNDLLIYSPFENGIYGRPSSSLSNSIGISLNNVLEAKVAGKEDEENEEEEDKKITILNNLDFNTSYNFEADSLRWSNVGFSAGIPLLKNKLNLNINGNFNPYQVTKNGTEINKFNKYILRLENISLSTNYTISSKDFDKKNNETEKKDNTNANKPPDILGTKINPTNDFAHKARTKTDNKNSKQETELYKAKIPWNVSFGYSFSYSDNGYSVAEVQNHTLDFSGNIDLTPKWKIGFRSGYDIKNGAFSYTTFNFARDLDSWRFNFNWIPFGERTSYNFFIGVKSSMLSDLKWDKQKPPDKRLF